jgi:uncharacterized protein YecT (DUF1311 family)
MTQQVGSDLESTDKKLNQIWGQIVKKYSANKPFIASLRKAERAWIVYRDKHVDSIWPNSDPNFYGSSMSMCRLSQLAGLTLQRTEDLKAILNQTVKATPVSPSEVAKLGADVTKTFELAVKAPNPDEPLFAKKFHTAQQAWLAFRDADADAWRQMSIPHKDSSAIRDNRIIQLDRARIQSLQEWVKGIPEGDVCSGSRPVK